ncbi:SRPBCC family protein [Kamptonema formosum]|uniref:SRPBCC family protein n=1 Tax=Kamptonema formosum TaxID=331992 RepID=UPI0003813A15|nr:SRPBCC family protein [Oscillatoria sp. PCC 10802]
MNMVNRWRTGLIAGCLSALAGIATVPAVPVRAGLFDGPVDRLPVEERVALRNGKTVVTGVEGNYVGKVLVAATPDVVWSVLTDYPNFPKFLPNVVSTQIVEANGNRKVVEQVSERQIFLVSVTSRVRTENTETEKQRIDFRLVDGDLKELQGFWLIEPVSEIPGKEPAQVLITQEVQAKPKGGTPEGMFYDIFKGAIEGNLKAIKKEVNKRSAK